MEGITVPAGTFGRAVGAYLRIARRRVVAVTYHGGVAGYLISPQVYAEILQRHARAAAAGMDAHDAAVARMEQAERARLFETGFRG